MQKEMSVAQQIKSDKYKISQLERRLFNDPCDNDVRMNLELMRRHLSNLLSIEAQKISQLN